MAEIKTKNGDVCKSENARASVTTTQDSVQILAKDGSFLMVSEDSAGTVMNNALSPAKQYGETNNSLLSTLNSYNPLAHALSAFTGGAIQNSSKSSSIIGDAMKAAGITCTDPSGKPSVPLLSVQEAKQLTEKPGNAR